MSSIRLTDTRIAAFSPSREQYLKDAGSRLQVRGRPTGSKTFVFRSTLNYRGIKITIGEYGPVTLESARAKAILWQGWIEEGKDPRQVMKQQEQERTEAEAARIAAAEAAALESRRREAPALEAWNAYVSARLPKWGEHSRHDHERVSCEGGNPITRGKRSTDDGTTQPGALRSLLALPLNRITAKRVELWLKTEAAHRPTHAALAFRLLRAFINWCATHPDYSSQTHADACAVREVRDEVPRKRAKNDCLQREQLSAWFEKVREIRNPVISAFLQILLLTGARREELAELRWDDVNFQWATLKLADKIEDDGRTIPLTPYVAALLRDLKARNETPPPMPRTLRHRIAAEQRGWEPSPWVFPSPKAESGRLQDPSSQHKDACVAAGIEGMTLHGLRRSFGTLSEWVEVPVGIVAQIMGHKPSATAERHYRRRPVDLLRRWHTKVEAWILAEAGIEQPQAEQVPKLRAVV
jgi:integrase